MFAKSAAEDAINMLSQLEILLGLKDRHRLFVGIGNVLHRDDGAGVYIVKNILEKQHNSTLIVETCLENYIGKINALRPDELVFVDSVFFNRQPGYWNCVPVDNIIDFTTNTHNISLKALSDFFSARTWVLGLQPLSVSFGEGLSEYIEHSANEIVEIINSYQYN